MAKHATQKSLSNWTKEGGAPSLVRTQRKVLKQQANDTYLRKLVLLYLIKNTHALLHANVHQCVKVNSTVDSQMMWLKRQHGTGADI